MLSVTLVALDLGALRGALFDPLAAMRAVTHPQQHLTTTPHRQQQIERLVADLLASPVRVSVGAVGAANEDVSQHVEVLDGGDGAKRAWLLARMQVRPQARMCVCEGPNGGNGFSIPRRCGRRLLNPLCPALSRRTPTANSPSNHIPVHDTIHTQQGFVDDGDVLVFAAQRQKAEALAALLAGEGYRAVALHGDMDQARSVCWLVCLCVCMFCVFVCAMCCSCLVCFWHRMSPLPVALGLFSTRQR